MQNQNQAHFYYQAALPQDMDFHGYQLRLINKAWCPVLMVTNGLDLNIRLNVMGCMHYSPVDETASIAAKEMVFDEYRAFESQSPSINYLDITISHRKNRSKVSRVWALQLRNALGYEDFDGFSYNFSEGKTEEVRSTVVIPNLTYKIEF